MRTERWLPWSAVAAVLAACGTTSSTGPSVEDAGATDGGGTTDSGSAADAGKPRDGAADAPIAITLGAPMQLLAPAQLGLRSVPDGQTSVLRQPDGTFHLWLAGQVSGVDGATAILSTSDFLTFAPVVDDAADGGDAAAAAPIFSASAPAPCGSGAPGSDAFDAQYAAPGTVLAATNGIDDLLMIFHAENHTFAGSCYKTLPFYATIGLARSADGGRSWTRQGAILSGRDPRPAIAPALTGGWGAAVPTVLRDGDYFYAFYSDYAVPGSGHPGSNPIMAARAPVSGGGAAGTWQKWNGGAFSSPGLGGDSTPILGIAGTTCVFPRQPGISFNAHLGKFLLTMICGAGWYFSVTSDLATQVWSPPEQFFVAPVDNQKLQPGDEYDWHLALVSQDAASGTTTGQAGYVLYSRGGYPNTPIHMPWRRSFTITP